eukprot:Protomagalhaensia_wolfi_Nauph_80__1918@NODE_2202_length_1171_cov_121_254417_g612_i4_p1_GENE_NODE_2202_length_1171_cov_121_254417_g612_i4NODE_2202_length_1171_cov_121_254417_g612_i4_p1_ORF_typecomplete_len132_score36_62_NODE_2202_length_1171_cov_121_254417_g612_i4363758
MSVMRRLEGDSELDDELDFNNVDAALDDALWERRRSMEGVDMAEEDRQIASFFSQLSGPAYVAYEPFQQCLGNAVVRRTGEETVSEGDKALEEETTTTPAPVTKKSGGLVRLDQSLLVYVLAGWMLFVVNV